jgi:hypothetical protein
MCDLVSDRRHNLDVEEDERAVRRLKKADKTLCLKIFGPEGGSRG